MNECYTSMFYRHLLKGNNCDFLFPSMVDKTLSKWSLVLMAFFFLKMNWYTSERSNFVIIFASLLKMILSLFLPAFTKWSILSRLAKIMTKFCHYFCQPSQNNFVIIFASLLKMVDHFEKAGKNNDKIASLCK